jgi:hypothetical protein
MSIATCPQPEGKGAGATKGLDYVVGVGDVGLTTAIGWNAVDAFGMYLGMLEMAVLLLN